MKNPMSSLSSHYLPSECIPALFFSLQFAGTAWKGIPPKEDEARQMRAHRSRSKSHACPQKVPTCLCACHCQATILICCSQKILSKGEHLCVGEEIQLAAMERCWSVVSFLMRTYKLSFKFRHLIAYLIEGWVPLKSYRHCKKWRPNRPKSRQTHLPKAFDTENILAAETIGKH